MASTIFQGSLVKCLKDTLQLGSQAKLKSGNIDPSAIATDGKAGDVYLSTLGAFYLKLDSGITTNWSKQAPLSAITFTTGSVPFAGPSGQLTEDNADFFFDNSTKTLTVTNLSVTGTQAVINSTDLYVKDKLITLNRGGNNASQSGIEFEENSLITGYVKVSVDRNSIALKAPNTSGIASIVPGSAGITINQDSHDPVTLGAANGLSLSTQRLSLDLAGTLTTGALSSADWNVFNNKEPAIASGTLTQYWRGDKSFQTLDTLAVAENTNLYFTNARARASVSANAPVNYNSTTGVFGLNSLTDADISASAAISLSKLAPLTNHNRALLSDNSGFVSESAVTNTELGYLSGVTSSVQAQIDTKVTKHTGDIDETSFSLANNQAVAANVTALSFSNVTIRSAVVQYSIYINATTPLYEAGNLYLIQKAASWEMSQTSVGDSSLVAFTVTSSGQVQYTSPSYTGFVSGTIKFRANTTTV